MTRVREEGGWALVTAMAVMTVILMFGIVMLDAADRLQARTGSERASETGFNMADGLLNTQVAIVGAKWPASSTTAYPPSCPKGSTNVRCPDSTALGRIFGGIDVNSATNWTVTVRDDLGTASTYYSKTVTDSTPCPGGAAPCAWDANANGVIWLRAEATVRGRSRIVVEQVRQAQQRMPFPRNVITANRFVTTNNGRKTIVDEKGCQAKHRPSSTCNATEPGPIAVRCTTAGATSSDPCLGYRADQVAPNLTTQGYTGNILPTGGLQQLKSAAIQAGTYYTSCPASWTQLAGKVVYIDAGGATCSYTANGVANSGAAPGVLIVNQGILNLSGTLDFYGVIFMANNLPSPQDNQDLLRLGGNVYIQGAIFAEGRGGVSAGASGVNVSFDPNAIGNVIVPGGGVSVVPNSFRELPAGG